MLFPCTFLVQSSRRRSSRAVETLVEREGVADEGVGANACDSRPKAGVDDFGISCLASCFASFLDWFGPTPNMKIFDFVVLGERLEHRPHDAEHDGRLTKYMACSSNPCSGGRRV